MRLGEPGFGDGYQVAGIEVNLGSLGTDVNIIGCDLRGPSTGWTPLYVVGGYSTNGTYCRYTNNAGFNPQGMLTTSPVPPGTGPYSYTNYFPFPVELYCSGGTLSSDATITGENDSTGVATGLSSGQFTLQPNDVWTVDYLAGNKPTVKIKGN